MTINTFGFGCMRVLLVDGIGIHNRETEKWQRGRRPFPAGAAQQLQLCPA
jgi:hypothetical protein